MDAAAIIALVTKGLSVAETVWENRDLALQAINSVKNIISKESPTPADITATEAALDALLVLIGLLVFLIGFPAGAYVMTRKGWVAGLMFLACAFLVFMALR